MWNTLSRLQIASAALYESGPSVEFSHSTLRDIAYGSPPRAFSRSSVVSPVSNPASATARRTAGV